MGPRGAASPPHPPRPHEPPRRWRGHRRLVVQRIVVVRERHLVQGLSRQRGGKTGLKVTKSNCTARKTKKKKGHLGRLELGVGVPPEAASPAASASAAKLALLSPMLAHTYEPGTTDVTGWLVSEKLDGVRAIW
jgi:ATP-dependent DNA ligase